MSRAQSELHTWMMEHEWSREATDMMCSGIGWERAGARFHRRIFKIKAPHKRYTPVIPKVPIPVALRWEIWERDNFTCRHCGVRRFLSVDHIVPESKGGTLDPDNLQTLCRSCNSRKGGR